MKSGRKPVCHRKLRRIFPQLGHQLFFRYPETCLLPTIALLRSRHTRGQQFRRFSALLFLWALACFCTTGRVAWMAWKQAKDPLAQTPRLRLKKQIYIYVTIIFGDFRRVCCSGTNLYHQTGARQNLGSSNEPSRISFRKPGLLIEWKVKMMPWSMGSFDNQYCPVGPVQLAHWTSIQQQHGWQIYVHLMRLQHYSAKIKTGRCFPRRHALARPCPIWHGGVDTCLIPQKMEVCRFDLFLS